MAHRQQLRQGSDVETREFIGAIGELTYNTTTKNVHAHDGVTKGGIALGAVQATENSLGASKVATTALVQAGTNDTDFITAKKLSEYNKSRFVGFDGGTWQTVPFSLGTFTNTTDKTIFVSLGINGGTVNVYVDEVYVGYASEATGPLIFPVPPRKTYRLNGGATGSTSRLSVYK